MIGGTDIVIANPGISPPELLDTLVRSIFQRWEHAVVQDGSDGRRFASYAAIPFRHLSELFIYRDQASFESWEQVGADPSNLNAMLHIIADDDEITMVVDDRNDTTMKSILAEAEQLLWSGIAWEWRMAA